VPKKSKLYREQFKQEICALIEQIDLPDLQKQFMKARWLEQLLWLEGRAQTNRNQYYLPSPTAHNYWGGDRSSLGQS